MGKNGINLTGQNQFVIYDKYTMPVSVHKPIKNQNKDLINI